MTLHVPKGVFVLVVVVLGIALGAVGALAITGGSDDAERADAAATRSTPPTPKTIATSAPAKQVVAKKLTRLTVRGLPDETTQQSITIRGRTTRGATVTIRGSRAHVHRGAYRLTLKLPLGTNRFTIVARHADRRTRRRPVKVVRTRPAPVASEVGCGGDPHAYRSADGTCIGPAHPPRPASPEDCPSGWVPVGVTGACAPATTDSQSYPDTNGPDDPCPAGTNWVEPDGCVGGDY